MTIENMKNIYVKIIALEHEYTNTFDFIYRFIWETIPLNFERITE